jgi:hypothetical protein
MAFLTGTNLLSLLLLVAAVLFLWAGVRAMLLGQKTIYFRHRRQRVLAGWRLTGAALLVGVIGLWIFRSGRPLFVPVLLSPTSTPVAASVSITPSRVSSPAPRPSLTVPVTASPSPAPQLPMSIEILAASSVTPQASAEIFDIRFAVSMEGVYPVGLRFEWANPIRRMYASFAHRNLTPGVQWTALWFRNGDLVFFETAAWDGEKRGRGYSKWEPAPHEWLPGEYEVQFFVGMDWKVTGRFTLTGDPLPPTQTPSAVPTRTPRPTLTLTGTPLNTPTPIPTSTPHK